MSRHVLFSVVIAGIVLFSGAALNVRAQRLCGTGRGMPPCSNVVAAESAVSPRNLSFEIGQDIADALIHKCSVFTGVVKAAAAEIDRGLVHVRFHITEQLRGDALDGDGDREFDLERTEADKRYLPDADLVAGHRLIVGECFNWSDVRFVLGDENYFSSIRSTIDFDETNDLQESFAGVLAPLKEQTDNVFAGYVTEYSWRAAAYGDVNERVKVYSRLMADPKFPALGLPRIGYGMLMMLYRDNSDLTDANRDDAMKRLVELGSGTDPDRKQTAILLLGRLSGDEKFQLKRYVDRSTSEKLIKTIRDSKIEDDSVARLVTMLQKIN